MQLEAVYHRPKLNWSYAYDPETIHLRIRTKRGDVAEVKALVCDKYDFARTFEALTMDKFATDNLFDYWQVSVKPPYRRLQYGFMLQNGSETIYMHERGFQDHPPKDSLGFFEYPYINKVDVTSPPDWVKEAVFYQIFPERFANGDTANDPEGTLPWGGKPERDNFFGGDLQGVLDKLDYLQELGVNALYFTPVFEATTNHKYDTRDYLKVDPHFGDNELLKKLVEACHERGIRVMLDAVFNHAGKTFPPFIDVQKNGADSKYADWFYVRSFPIEVQDGIPTYETFSFEPLMPKFNTEHPEVREYLLGVAKYWVEEVGIDGWRLDVANEVDHQFWRDFRKIVKDVRPDAYILGEIWHDAMMWLQGDQFDAAMNYPFTNAVLDFFGKGLIDGQGFSNAIGALLSNYPAQIHEVSFNLLDSHDTARLLNLCGEDKGRMKLASLFQLTFYGAPCIYYGDEIGMTGENDPDCRRCMEWNESEQDRDLFDHYRTLIGLRKQHAALRNGDFRFLYAKAGDRRIAYQRSNSEEQFVIVANASDAIDTISVPDLEGTYEDCLTGEVVKAGKLATSIELPAYGFKVLRKA